MAWVKEEKLLKKTDQHKINFPSNHFTYTMAKTVGKEEFLTERIDDAYSVLSERTIRENSILLINFDNYNLKFLDPE